MYMISAQEKEVLIKEIMPELSKYVAEEGAKGHIFLKALSNYILKTTPNADFLLGQACIEVKDANPEFIRQSVSRLMSYVIEVATDENKFVVQYTTGQMAKFMGVSVQTINNWIHEGRFLGVEKKEKNKQARIPENAIFISSAGERIPVQELVEMYNEQLKKQNADFGKLMYSQQLTEISKEIGWFEEKYGGDYQATLGAKKTLTSEEERDAAEWRYLIRKVKEL